MEEARSYWAHANPGETQPQRVERAFSERWFGSRSVTRVKYLVLNLDYRFMDLPRPLAALRRWRPEGPAERRLVCHWHLQFTDPLYRNFTGGFLPLRRLHREPSVDTDAVVRWLNQQFGNRWAPATSRRMANGLLAAAAEAGLCGSTTPARQVLIPKVPDRALSYLLYLLREVCIEGSLTQNPYVASVGLEGDLLEARLRRGVSGLAYRRVAEVREFDWEYPDLETWGEGAKG